MTAKPTSSNTSSRRPSQIPPQPGSREASSSTIDTAVTRLLVSTKSLLEGLSQWANGTKTDEAISDIYVKLGNDFNDCARAFSKAGISFSDLLSVPAELRECLETCLSVDVASPATLEQHLPAIRETISIMLQGLKVKQQQFKQLAQRSPSNSQQGSSADTSRQRPRLSSNSMTNSVSTQNKNETSSRSTRGQIVSTTSSTNSDERLSYQQDPNPQISRSRTSPSSRPTSERAPYATHSRETSLPTSTSRPPLPPQPSLPKSQSANALSNRPGTPSNLSQTVRTSIPPSPALPTLTFEPAPSADIIPRTPSKGKSDGPGMASSPSFDALKQSENLTRRASKRFSRYTFQTMGASPTQGTSSVMATSPSKLAGSASVNEISTSPSTARKLSKAPPRQIPLPPLPIPSSSANQSLLNASQSAPPRSNSVSSDSWSAHVKDLDARDPSTIAAGERARRPSDPWNAYVSQLDSGPTLDRLAEEDESTPTIASSMSPAPFANSTITKGPPDNMLNASQASSAASSSSILVKPEASFETIQEGTVTIEDDEPPPPSPTSIPIYISLGRETKKAIIEPDQGPITVASLRVLFMDKFSYNSGQEDFPAIYIRDPRLGVEYELENMDEVRDGCVLSLNIEPLDQVKQHIDTAFVNLSKDLKDLKTAIAVVRRASIPPPPRRESISQVAAVISPRPESVKTPVTASSSHFPMSPMSEKVISDLRGFKDDVQNVRRDLAVLRQIYADYTSQNKGIINGLRTQIEKVKEVAATKVSASRAFIDAGKSKLDNQSQDLLTKIETLMDTVESVRDDVTVRRVRPLTSKVSDIRRDIANTRAELDEVRSHVTSIKPSWKQTWSKELQNVVEEERFLKHQEELLSDLSEDHRSIADLFGKIDELLQQPGSLRGPSGKSTREFIPPEPDENHTGLPTVMTEVKSLAVDPDRRLRAIAQAERKRDEDKIARKGNDAFASELGGFVDNRLLKKTGGAEETERVRRLKSEAQLKQMYDTATATALPDSPKGSVNNSRPSSAGP